MATAQQTAVLAAIRRRLPTIAYAAQMIEHVAFAIGREADYPSSPELHERLKTILALSRRGHAPAARERVLRELADLRIFGLLSNGDARIERNLSPRLHALNLPYVGRLAAKACARVPRRQGRGKFYPDPVAGPNPLEYCALIISLAWQKDAGEWPGYGNPTAQLICELLWRLALQAAATKSLRPVRKAGGVQHLPHSGFVAPDTFATWREHLRAARRYLPPHRAGMLVASILAPPSSDRAGGRTSNLRMRDFYDHPTSKR